MLGVVRLITPPSPAVNSLIDSLLLILKYTPAKVRLPDSACLTTALCKISTGKCLVATHIEDAAAQIRVGVFATDASYWQYYLGYQGVNVSISFSGGKGDLNMLAEPGRFTSHSHANPDFTL